MFRILRGWNVTVPRRVGANMDRNTITKMLLGAALLAFGGLIGYTVGLQHAPTTVEFGTSTTVHPPAVSALYPPLPSGTVLPGYEDLKIEVRLRQCAE